LAAGAGLLLAALSGCGGPDVERALLADRVPPARHADLAARYAVRCPDVLEVSVGGPRPWRDELAVDSDGRLSLGPAGVARVDGLTPPQAADAVAAALGVPRDQVRVRVASYASRQVFVHGEVSGLERAVPYVGPETVLELLQRVGGLAPGAAPDEVQVVRSHVADGRAPEVFTIDLRAILIDKDAHSNVRVQPSDQVYVGQSRRSCLSQCLPRWARPFFDDLVGLKADHGPEARKDAPPK
jgi:protein involved in polysaccharide export with SLBB domain